MLLLDAATVVTAAPNTTVTLGPVYSFIEPYLLAAFGVVFSGLLGWALTIFQQRTGITIQADARAAINTAAMNAAGRIMASQDPNFANAKVDVKSPLIAEELPKVGAYVESQIKSLGYTPEHVADLITAKVGILQAQAQGTSAVRP